MNDTSMFSPCPFCGGTNLSLVHFSTAVKCNMCGMETRITEIYGNKQERIMLLASKWNQRVQ